MRFQKSQPAGAYSVVLIPIRVLLFLLVDTSCNESGIAECNPIHITSRPNFEPVHEHNAGDMYERWLNVISEDNSSSSSAKQRNFSALLRKIMSKAQSKF
jgi:hypothetical protein